MVPRKIWAVITAAALAAPAYAQVSRDAKFEILRTVIAQQAASRMALPRGGDGVELSESGQINQDEVNRQLDKDGEAIEPGKVVTVTNVDFGSRSIEIELDGGGKKKKGFLDHLEVGIGNRTQNVGGDQKEDAKGSRIVLKFAEKVPVALTPEQLRAFLDPVLDFNRSSFLKTGVDALPPEFREAVLAKEARIGMDRSTVLLALGRPDNRVREKVNGVDQEDWIYHGKGYRTTFVTFEDNVVVRIREHGSTTP